MTFFIVVSSILGIFVLIAILGGLFSSKQVIVTRKVTDAKGEGFLSYCLPESVVNIEVKLKVAVTVDMVKKTIKSAEIVEQEFVVSQETVPETGQIFSLEYSSNPFHSDNIEFKINEKGLLESGTAVTEDKSAASVSLLTGGVTDLSKSAMLKSSSPKETMIEDNYRVEIQDHSRIFSERFHSLSTNTIKVEDVPVPEGTVGKGIAKKTINTKTLNAHTEFDWFVQIESSETSESTSMHFKFILQVQDVDNTIVEKIGATDILKGVLTRPKKAVRLRFMNAKYEPIGKLIGITVSDSSQAYLVPMKRSAFVKREDSIIMKDGHLLSHKLVQPSSYEGFVSIPVAIAKAIVSIPAQLVSINIDSIKSRASLNKELASLANLERERKKEVLTEELALDKLQLQIKEQELMLQQHLATRNDVLQKSIDTAEKNLLDTKEDILETEKKIIELQKQIGKLNQAKQ